MKRILPFILILLAASAAAQTYTHPTTGMNGEYIGACMTSTCSGTYTDGGGNYSAGINNIYRTFCPNAAGKCMRVCFNSIAMATGNCVPGNTPCDILQIGNGPTQNSSLLYTVDYDDNGTTPCFTSTDASGCLTFRFRSVIGGAAGWSATLSCVNCSANTIADNNDCISATSICSNATFTGASIGPGISSEGCSGCNTSEHFTNWYKFCAQINGTLQFMIDPSVNTQDYDFALYGPNATCTSLGTPVRCSYAAGGGNTGMRTASSDASENVSGDGWVSTLNVSAGDCFYLMISQWSAGGAGFTVDFTGSTANLLNCTILPVELTYFDVSRQGKIALVDWSTASEINNDHFDIERSADGKIFTAIASMRGKGNTSDITYYAVKDEHPLPGISYYRLKQVDFDGQFSYSEIKALRMPQQSSFAVLSNDGNANYTIAFNATEEGSGTMSVYDFSGRMISSQALNYKDGYNAFTFATENLSPGIYLVALDVDGEMQKTKFIKD
jgi:hypothetical protein